MIRREPKPQVLQDLPDGILLLDESNNLREAPEQIRILNLESENKKLKSELEDTLETVDILKRVIADYTKKWQGESSPGGSKKK